MEYRVWINVGTNDDPIYMSPDDIIAILPRTLLNHNYDNLIVNCSETDVRGLILTAVGVIPSFRFPDEIMQELTDNIPSNNPPFDLE